MDDEAHISMHAWPTSHV